MTQPSGGPHLRPVPAGGEPALAPEPASPEDQEQIHEAIQGVLDKHQAPAVPPHERRAHPRVVFNRPIDLEFDDPPRTISGYARDLSKGGMAFISHEPLQGQITIAFAPKQDEAPLKVRCKVVRCGLIQEGFYDIGMTFLRLEGTP